MKLRELLNNLNKSLEDIKGVRYNEHDEFVNEILSRVNPVVNNTELRKLIRLDSLDVRLIKEKDINTHGAGEELFIFKVNIIRDKRMKFGSKGKFDFACFVFNDELDEQILDYELCDLQMYFDKVNLKSSIEWCDKQILNFKNKIAELENEKEKFKEEFKNRFDIY